MLTDLTLLTSKGNELHKKINLKEVELLKLIKHVVKRCETLAFKKKILIRVKKSPDIKIIGDETRLEKLFLNIIKNAIAYGREEGWISITISKNKNFASISIADNGIGIKADDVPFVFDRFFRTNEVRTENYKGVGLGLSIAKWITEAHGGKISVVSSSGKGSTFTISLPINGTE